MKVWPQQDFHNFCVLGWLSWSHIGLSHDIGAATLGTAGYYIFGLIPFSYPTGDATKNASLYCDVPTQLLDTTLSTKTTALAGVLWVLEGFMRALKNESDEGRKKKRLSHSRCLVPLGHLPAQNVSNGPSELIFQFEPARFYLKHDPNRSLFSIPFFIY